MSWFKVFLSVIDTNLNYVITMLQLGPSFDPFLWQLVILKIKDWVSREKQVWNPAFLGFSQS